MGLIGLGGTQGGGEGGEVSHVIYALIFHDIRESRGTKWERAITESTPDASTECLDHLCAAFFGVFDKLRF